MVVRCGVGVDFKISKSRGILTAARLLMPVGLVKHAVIEGTKAVTKYTGSE